jgi:UrcA family protein
MKPLLRACAFLLIVAMASHWARSADLCPAIADSSLKSATISLQDLDLTTEEGMRAARERVHQAARRLCGQVVKPWSISHQPDYVACVAATTNAAVAQLHVPAVAANRRGP